MLGPMGAAGSNCPRFFFSLFPLLFSTSGGVGSDAPGPTRPCFFLVFFHARRIGVSRMSCTRPDSPSIFPPFFSTPGGVASAAGVASAWAAPGPNRPRFFPFFPRQVEWCPPQEWHPHGPHQARLALVFPPLPFFHVRWGGMAPAAPGGRCLTGLLFSRVCIISPLEGRRRR